MAAPFLFVGYFIIPSWNIQPADRTSGVQPMNFMGMRTVEAERRLLHSAIPTSAALCTMQVFGHLQIFFWQNGIFF
jgi:hypothetical protein